MLLDCWISLFPSPRYSPRQPRLTSSKYKKETLKLRAPPPPPPPAAAIAPLLSPCFQIQSNPFVSKNFSNICDTTSPTSVANLLTPAPRSAAPKAPNRPLVPSLVSLFPPLPTLPFSVFSTGLLPLFPGIGENLRVYVANLG